RQRLNVFSSKTMVLTWAPTIALLYAFAHFQSRVAAESKSLTECCVIIQLRFLKDKFTVIISGGDIQMDTENFPCDVQSCITQIQDNQTEKVCKIEIYKNVKANATYLFDELHKKQIHVYNIFSDCNMFPTKQYDLNHFNVKYFHFMFEGREKKERKELNKHMDQ
ncbi:hypothetical protein RFI_34219, partial [Reticulomyxa filosa]